MVGSNVMQQDKQKMERFGFLNKLKRNKKAKAVKVETQNVDEQDLITIAKEDSEHQYMKQMSLKNKNNTSGKNTLQNSLSQHLDIIASNPIHVNNLFKPTTLPEVEEEKSTERMKSFCSLPHIETENVD